MKMYVITVTYFNSKKRHTKFMTYVFDPSLYSRKEINSTVVRDDLNHIELLSENYEIVTISQVHELKYYKPAKDSKYFKTH